MIYSRNATVSIAARFEEKANSAIEDIKRDVFTSTGSLVFLDLDLNDLNSGQKTQLHVLFNNADVMVSNAETKPRTTQGYELSLGVNCIGTCLFTKLFTPRLISTAKSEPANTVRVVWLSSFGLEFFGVKDTGISLDNLDYHITKWATEKYSISKSGCWALGVKFARRHEADSIVSVPINPGNLTSDLARDQPMTLKLIAKMLGYPTAIGYVWKLGRVPRRSLSTTHQLIPALVPFGRHYTLRQDLSKATLTEEEGDWRMLQILGMN